MASAGGQLHVQNDTAAEDGIRSVRWCDALRELTFRAAAFSGQLNRGPPLVHDTPQPGRTMDALACETTTETFAGTNLRESAAMLSSAVQRARRDGGTPCTSGQRSTRILSLVSTLCRRILKAELNSVSWIEFPTAELLQVKKIPTVCVIRLPPIVQLLFENASSAIDAWEIEPSAGMTRIDDACQPHTFW